MKFEELEKAHREASAAYETYSKAHNVINAFLDGEQECNHPGPLTKSGKRDKRSRCDQCQTVAMKAQDKATSLYYDYGKVWDLFERIGMPL